jgi:hypothetical protein
VDQATALLDLLIALLQSIVVLLLASGFYIALAVRKENDSPGPDERETAMPPRGPRGIASHPTDLPSV